MARTGGCDVGSATPWRASCMTELPFALPTPLSSFCHCVARRNHRNRKLRRAGRVVTFIQVLVRVRKNVDDRSKLW